MAIAPPLELEAIFDQVHPMATMQVVGVIRVRDPKRYSVQTGDGLRAAVGGGVWDGGGDALGDGVCSGV
jgi:hypothetical protein